MLFGGTVTHPHRHERPTRLQEAIKSLDVRVRSLTGVDKSGVPLMLDAFRATAPRIDVSKHTGKSGADERQGFEAIFRGVMLGMRNPGAHELFAEGDPQQALGSSGSSASCTAESTTRRWQTAELGRALLIPATNECHDRAEAHLVGSRTCVGGGPGLLRTTTKQCQQDIQDEG
jgi:Protein of unknown function (Hypoth_ymh)